MLCVNIILWNVKLNWHFKPHSCYIHFSIYFHEHFTWFYLLILAIIIVDISSLTRGRVKYYVNELIKSLKESDHTTHNVMFYLTLPFLDKNNGVM